MNRVCKAIPVMLLAAVVVAVFSGPQVRGDAISGLSPVWRVKADDLGTGSGGGHGYVNGQAVTQWNDLVSTNNLLTAEGGRQNPVYRTNLGAFDGHSAVYFDTAGGKDALGISGSAPGFNSSAQTMVAVFARTGSAGVVLGYTGSNDWSNRRTIGCSTYLNGEKGTAGRLVAGDSAGGSAWGQSAATLPTYTAGDKTSQVWAILTVDGSGSPTDKIYLNNGGYTGFTQDGSFTYDPPSPGKLWVGDTYHGSSAGFNGYLAEAIIWNRVLTAGEIQTVAKYLYGAYVYTPEPAGAALLGLGGLLVTLRRRRA
jgi:hypothetical protein